MPPPVRTTLLIRTGVTVRRHRRLR